MTMFCIIRLDAHFGTNPQNLKIQHFWNQLLLDEFSTNLGIKYEEAQVSGKTKKRVLTIADINALEPFHWGYSNPT